MDSPSTEIGIVSFSRIKSIEKWMVRGCIGLYWRGIRSLLVFGSRTPRSRRCRNCSACHATVCTGPCAAVAKPMPCLVCPLVPDIAVEYRLHWWPCTRIQSLLQHFPIWQWRSRFYNQQIDRTTKRIANFALLVLAQAASVVDNRSPMLVCTYSLRCCIVEKREKLEQTDSLVDRIEFRHAPILELDLLTHYILQRDSGVYQ